MRKSSSYAWNGLILLGDQRLWQYLFVMSFFTTLSGCNKPRVNKRFGLLFGIVQDYIWSGVAYCSGDKLIATYTLGKKQILEW